MNIFLLKICSLIKMALFEYYNCTKDPEEVKVPPSKFWMVATPATPFLTE